jgi:hypothetical protein
MSALMPFSGFSGQPGFDSVSRNEAIQSLRVEKKRS